MRFGNDMASIAYLAGLIDGEGYVGLQVKKRSLASYYWPVLIIGMAEKGKTLLVELQAAYGGSLHNSRKSSAEWQAAWAWTITGSNAVGILTAALPHLRLKREQAKAVIRLHETACIASAGWTRRQWASGVQAQMGACYRRIRELNKRGPSALM